jgi:hypothetical protein
MMNDRAAHAAVCLVPCAQQAAGIRSPTARVAIVKDERTIRNECGRFTKLPAFPAAPRARWDM